jgi:RNA polymerase sigma-70 factor (ECF subfamily)
MHDAAQDMKTDFSPLAVENGIDLESLVRRLNDGDPAAAGPLLQHFEPYLRMAVRRHLNGRIRSKFDSEDVVQSAMADLIVHFRDSGRAFEDGVHIRNFLNRVVLNRLHDRFRRHRREMVQQKVMHESELGEISDSGNDRPSRDLSRNELWETIMKACPERHRQVILLRKEGLRHTEIAGRLGLHPSTVRRVIAEVARQMQTGQTA